jgi:hypothetical protein
VSAQFAETLVQKLAERWQPNEKEAAQRLRCYGDRRQASRKKMPAEEESLSRR